MLPFSLSDGLWQAETTMPPLGVKVKVYVMQEGDSGPTARQLAVLDSFARLSDDLSRQIADHARRYCERIDAVVDLAAEGVVVDKQEIAKHFRFTSILVPEIRNCASDFVFVSADCDWEPEHGMQVLVENGCVVSCGEHSSLPFGGAWAKYISDEKDQ